MKGGTFCNTEYNECYLYTTGIYEILMAIYGERRLFSQYKG